MKEILIRIADLKTKYTCLYTDFDNNFIMKHVGKIPGIVDSEHVYFLKETNGASILDYCFFGLKNKKLGANVYDVMIDLWYGDNSLSQKFWGMIATSTGEYFGYLDKENNSGGHFVGYYNSNMPEKVYIVASSFSVFLDKFLSKIEVELSKNNEILDMDEKYWSMNVNALIENDPEMQAYITSQNNNNEYLSIIYAK